MNTDRYEDHYIGESVHVSAGEDSSRITFAGIITKLGSNHAVVNDYITGNNYDVDYRNINMVTTSSIVKTAQAEIIMEEEKEGKKFILVKNEANVDGTLSITYEVKVDDKTMWESEETTTNVYDVEDGWSVADDFDENKLDLIQQGAEAGFDMMVDSYVNMMEIVQESSTLAEGELGEEGEAAVGEPAFAEDASELGGEDVGGGAGGATMIDNGGGTEGDVVGEDGEAGDVIDESVESDVGGAEPFAEEPIAVETSLEKEADFIPSFARSILASNKTAQDSRLHGNPEHRLNPAVRQEMDRKNIPTDTNDIELADELKNFDYTLKNR